MSTPSKKGSPRFRIALEHQRTGERIPLGEIEAADEKAALRRVESFRKGKVALLGVYIPKAEALQ